MDYYKNGQIEQSIENIRLNVKQEYWCFSFNLEQDIQKDSHY
jgi:hypothetical protein